MADTVSAEAVLVLRLARLLLLFCPMLTASLASAQSPEAPKKPANPIRLDRYGDPLPEGAKMRFGTTRWLVEPPRIIVSSQSATFSPDGLRFLTADQSEIRTIDVETGKELARVKLALPKRTASFPFTESINYAFSKDCKTLATVQRHLKRVCLWDVSSGKLIRQFDVPGFDAESLLWSQDGTTMVMREYPAGSNVRGLRVWDLVKGAEIKLVGRDGKKKRPEWGTISDDSKILAGPVAENVVGIWNLRTGQMLHEINVSPYLLDTSPDGELFACLEENSTQLRLWNMTSGKELPPIRGVGGSLVTTFGFSPSGDLMVICGEHARFWNLNDRKVLRDITLPENTWWWFSPNGKTLAFFDASTLRLFDAATGRELHPLDGHTGVVKQLLVSPDGKTLFSKDRHAHLWDIASGTLQCSIDVLKASDGCPSFSSDSKLIANPDSEGRIHARNVSNGKEVKQFAAPSKLNPDALEGLDCHFSTDMKTMAAIGRFTTIPPTPVLIWDVERGNLVTYRELPTEVNGCFSADNKLLALGLTEEGVGRVGPILLLQDAVSGRALFKTSSGSIVHLAFSSDGRTLAGVRDRRVRNEHPHPSDAEFCIWEVATGKERICFETKGYLSFAWSLDRRRAATLDFRSCSVWSAITGQEVFNKTSSSDRVGDFWSCTFSQDAKTLLTGMDDRTILTWELPSENASNKKLKATDLEIFWTDLNNPDAGKAHLAIWSLIDSADKAVPFLNKHLHPASDKDGQAIERSIAALDNASFAIREGAQKELMRLHFDARPFLQAALEKNPTLETRHRIESILSFPADKPSESLAQLRAIEVLEYIGSKEARRGLEIMAKGAPQARLTQEAKASLERLNLAH